MNEPKTEKNIIQSWEDKKSTWEDYLFRNCALLSVLEGVDEANIVIDFDELLVPYKCGPISKGGVFFINQEDKLEFDNKFVKINEYGQLFDFFTPNFANRQRFNEFKFSPEDDNRVWTSVCKIKKYESKNLLSPTMLYPREQAFLLMAILCKSGVKLGKIDELRRFFAKVANWNNKKYFLTAYDLNKENECKMNFTIKTKHEPKYAQKVLDLLGIEHSNIKFCSEKELLEARSTDKAFEINLSAENVAKDNANVGSEGGIHIGGINSLDALRGSVYKGLIFSNADIKYFHEKEITKKELDKKLKATWERLLELSFKKTERKEILQQRQGDEEEKTSERKTDNNTSDAIKQTSKVLLPSPKKQIRPIRTLKAIKSSWQSSNFRAEEASKVASQRPTDAQKPTLGIYKKIVELKITHHVKQKHDENIK